MGADHTRELLAKLYANRFDEADSRSKLELWRTLVDAFLQRRIRADARVLDIGGGNCEFINHVRAAEKHTIDLNLDARRRAAPEVVVHSLDVVAQAERWELFGHFDHVFVSNFFEHLENRHELLHVLEFCRRVLVRGGTLIVIQPNFKYAFREYFDFFDHVLPITDGSMREALLAAGFEIDELVPRFLPYTTKGRPTSAALLRVYLTLPILWRVFGGQMFVVARRTS